MKTADEAYQGWLDEVMVPSFVETRREFAKKTGANFADLEWAFVMGYVCGQDSLMEIK